jgi:hypothetical protein
VPLTLQCSITTLVDLSKIDRIFQVDFEKREVSGYSATISEGTVRFAAKVDDTEFLYTLSRVPGQLVVGTSEFPQLQVGLCEAVTGRKF